MRKQVSRVLGTVLLLGMLDACREKAPEPQPFELGVMVLNAGNFAENNGSISYFTREKSIARGDIFFEENGRPLTGSVQGYNEVGGHSIILVDNSLAGQDKVEILNFGNFKSEATLTAPDIENPRFVLRVSPTKAYISCWGETGDFANFFKNPGYIAVVDMTSLKVVKKIPTLKGPEKMVKAGNEIFVGTVGGGSQLLVIDGTTDTALRTLAVGLNPDPLAIDFNGKMWVQTGFSVARINPKTDALETTMRVGTHPQKTPSNFAMTPDGMGFYYVYSFYDAGNQYIQKGETYYFSINDTKITADKPIIKRVFTGLAVDPLQGLIYGGVTPSYKQAGYVVRYRNDGSKIDSIKVEIAPSGFFFK